MTFPRSDFVTQGGTIVDVTSSTEIELVCLVRIGASRITLSTNVRPDNDLYVGFGSNNCNPLKK